MWALSLEPAEAWRSDWVNGLGQCMVENVEMGCTGWRLRTGLATGAELLERSNG